MKSLKQIDGESYDLVVIGGGISGAGLIRDAALRGMKCLLIEKNDFAHGASSKSGKLVHGGLRYLKNLQFKLVAESLSERNKLHRIIAPHLVEVTEFFFVTYKKAKLSRPMLIVAMVLYHLLSIYNRLGKWKILSKNNVMERYPLINRKNCTGGVTYFDCKTNDARLTLETILSAKESGAEVFNHVELSHLKSIEKGYLIELFDKFKLDSSVVIKSKTVINATGPWVDQLLKGQHDSFKFGIKASTGVHLFFDKDLIPLKNTISFEHPDDSRPLYIVPFEDYILYGTTDDFQDSEFDKLPVSDSEIAYLLNAINALFPSLDLNTENILHITKGIRPLIEERLDDQPSNISRDYQFSDNEKGLISVTGGKLTTHRKMAEKTLNYLLDQYFPENTFKKSQTTTPLWKSNATSKESRFALRFGDRAYLIDEIVRQNKSLEDDIDKNTNYCWAEIHFFIKFEMARTIDDILYRRSTIGQQGLSLSTDTSEKIEALLIETNR